MKYRGEMIILLLFMLLGCSRDNPAEANIGETDDSITISLETHEIEIPRGVRATGLCIDAVGDIWISGEFIPRSGERIIHSYIVLTGDSVVYGKTPEVGLSGDTSWYSGVSIDCNRRGQVTLLLENTRMFAIDSMIPSRNPSQAKWWKSEIRKMEDGRIIELGMGDALFAHGIGEIEYIATGVGSGYNVRSCTKARDGSSVSFVVRKAGGPSILMVYDDTDNSIDETPFLDPASMLV